MGMKSGIAPRAIFFSRPGIAVFHINPENVK